MSNPITSENVTTAEILRQVQSLMSELFGLPVEKVQMEAHLIDDLDLDSLDAIDMAVKLQEVTGHRVEEGALKSLRTVGDVVHLVETILNNQAAGRG